MGGGEIFAGIIYASTVPRIVMLVSASAIVIKLLELYSSKNLAAKNNQLLSLGGRVFFARGGFLSLGCLLWYMWISKEVEALGGIFLWAIWAEAVGQGLLLIALSSARYERKFHFMLGIRLIQSIFYCFYFLDTTNIFYLAFGYFSVLVFGLTFFLIMEERGVSGVGGHDFKFLTMAIGLFDQLKIYYPRMLSGAGGVGLVASVGAVSSVASLFLLPLSMMSQFLLGFLMAEGIEKRFLKKYYFLSFLSSLVFSVLFLLLSVFFIDLLYEVKNLKLDSLIPSYAAFVFSVGLFSLLRPIFIKLGGSFLMSRASFFLSVIAILSTPLAFLGFGKYMFFLSAVIVFFCFGFSVFVYGKESDE